MWVKVNRSKHKKYQWSQLISEVSVWPDNSCGHITADPGCSSSSSNQHPTTQFHAPVPKQQQSTKSINLCFIVKLPPIYIKSGIKWPSALNFSYSPLVSFWSRVALMCTLKGVVFGLILLSKCTRTAYYVLVDGHVSVCVNLCPWIFLSSFLALPVKDLFPRMWKGIYFIWCCYAHANSISML